MISVKLDENLGLSAIELLALGMPQSASTTRGYQGPKTPLCGNESFKSIASSSPLDLDFADIRRFPPGSHPGVLLLRPRSRSRDAVLSVLRRVLREYPLQTLSGCLAVADEQRTRIRRPSP
jgi:hypothetical protein